MTHSLIFIALALILAVFALHADAGYIVISQFQDKYNPARIYQPGEPVPSWFTQDRIIRLLHDRKVVFDGEPIGAYSSSS
jgi:hypothetical protein